MDKKYKPKIIDAKDMTKYSGVLVAGTYIVKIKKISNNEDDDILNEKFYKSTDLTLGAEIVNGEFPLSELKTEPTEKIKVIEEERIEK